jgi:hypothetical protein
MKKLFGLKDETGKDVIIQVKPYPVNPGFFICGVEEEEPKPEFKPGQWAVTAYGEIFRILSLKDGWVCWINNKGENVRSNADHLKFTIPREIESHLIKIAKEKGLLKDGLLVRSPTGANFRVNMTHEFDYDMKSDNLCNLGMFLYQQGVWAEIVPEKKKLPKTKDELSDLIKAYWISPFVWDEFLKDYED